MDRSQVAQRTKELLVDGLRLEMETDEIDDSEAIFGEGLGLDSIDVLEFVALVEEEFDVAIPDEEIAREAFASISALTDFILAQKADATAPS